MAALSFQREQSRTSEFVLDLCWFDSSSSADFSESPTIPKYAIVSALGKLRTHRWKGNDITERRR